MRRLGIGTAILALVLGTATMSSSVQAQCTTNGAPDSCGVPGSVSLIAGRVVRLQMSAGSTSLSAPTTADFDAGFNATTGPTLTVSANAPWTLHLRSTAAFWSATNTSPGAPARTTKPAGDLSWSTSSSGSFSPLTTSDANLITGPASASNATTLYFQTLYDWALDTPGNYSLSIVLTLTAP
jgi:hypothetical protein